MASWREEELGQVKVLYITITGPEVLCLQKQVEYPNAKSNGCLEGYNTTSIKVKYRLL